MKEEEEEVGLGSFCDTESLRDLFSSSKKSRSMLTVGLDGSKEEVGRVAEKTAVEDEDEGGDEAVDDDGEKGMRELSDWLKDALLRWEGSFGLGASVSQGTSSGRCLLEECADEGDSRLTEATRYLEIVGVLRLLSITLGDG